MKTFTDFLIKIDDNTINAARDLGANYFQTLRKIIIPLSVPGIASGVIMVFVPALTTFVISDILGGGKLLLIGNLIENKVKADIEKTIENRKLQDMILEVSVPMQNVTETKGNGEEKLVQKKLFPAYVLINMIMNDETWYVVRNTRGVTGFVGPGSKPVPLTEEEMLSMGLNATVKADIDLEVGETVVVTKGVWEDTTGLITAINDKNQTVTINIDMFGRETPVEISFTDIKKL